MPQLQTIVWGTIYIVNIFYLDMLLTKYNKNIHKTKQIPFDNSHSLYNNVWRDMWLHLGNQYMEICTLNGISNHCLNKTVGQLQIDQMKLWINRMKSTMRGNQTVIFFSIWWKWGEYVVHILRWICMTKPVLRWVCSLVSKESNFACSFTSCSQFLLTLLTISALLANEFSVHLGFRVHDIQAVIEFACPKPTFSCLWTSY